MAVYLDLVMGLNFLVDLLLILGTNRLAGFPPGLLRAAGAAALGAVYAVGCLLPSFRFLGNGLWRMVSLGLMGLMAFGMNRSALKRTGIFLLLAMAMGGVAAGMGQGNFGMLVISAGVVFILCRVSFGGRIGGREYVPLIIQSEKSTVSLTALKDTGNTLQDPISGEEVLVVSSEYAARLLGLSESELQSPMSTLVSGKVHGLRLIPYRAVGQPGSMLLAKRFDRVKIGEERGSFLVAFAPERIGTGEVYQALIGGTL